jgi:hypothetical protein
MNLKFNTFQILVDGDYGTKMIERLVEVCNFLGADFPKIKRDFDDMDYDTIESLVKEEHKSSCLRALWNSLPMSVRLILAKEHKPIDLFDDEMEVKIEKTYKRHKKMVMQGLKNNWGEIYYSYEDDCREFINNNCESGWSFGYIEGDGSMAIISEFQCDECGEYLTEFGGEWCPECESQVCSGCFQDGICSRCRRERRRENAE